MSNRFNIIIGNVQIFDSVNHEIEPIREIEIKGLKFKEYSILIHQNYTILPIGSSNNYILRVFDFKEHIKQLKIDFPKNLLKKHKKNFKGYNKKHIISLLPVIDIIIQKKDYTQILYFNYLESNQILILVKVKNPTRILAIEGFRASFHSFNKDYHGYLLHEGKLSNMEQLESYIYGNVNIIPK